MRLIILASSIYSERACAVVASLCESGYVPSACLSVSIVDPKNILRKIGQYGLRSFGTYAIKRLNPFKKSNDLEKTEYSFSNLTQACQHYDISLFQSRNIQDTQALNFLKRHKPDLLVYTGGGILRKTLINIPTIGVLNAHGGILPKYRGMNVMEWALLYNDIDNIGITVHLIDPGIDTGSILFHKRLKIPNEAKSIQSLRNYFTNASVDALVDGVKLLDAESPSFQPQIREAGKQYFVMHQSLLEVAERRLNSI